MAYRTDRHLKILFLAVILTASCAVNGGLFAEETAEKPLEKAAETSPKPEEHKAEESVSPEITALQEYNKGVELFQVAQIQAEKGNQKGQKTLLTEAIHHFEKALKLNAQLVEAQSNIGFAQLTLRKYSQAEASFKTALKLNPHHINTLNGLATTQALKGDLDQAVKTFDQLLILIPDNPQYWFNKGSVMQRAGKADEAQKAYEKALALEPNDQRSLFNLATLLHNQGQLMQAKPFYEKAKRISISNPIGLECIHRLELIGQGPGQTTPESHSSSEVPAKP
ncbi:MAG: tetratricopeptide repeat protein [Cyanobacteria bacterium]|nr:tetratricopeptide repeat protein [Cyanobacteriota bacterium]